MREDWTPQGCVLCRPNARHQSGRSGGVMMDGTKPIDAGPARVRARSAAVN